MDSVKIQIKELKLIQQFPKYHLASFFEQLKANVDLFWNKKIDSSKSNYLEIIKTIETFETDAYKNLKLSLVNNSVFTKHDEIKSLEDRINATNMSNDNQIQNFLLEIERIKFEIEKELFSNKTILFLEPFLLIINDAYIFYYSIDSTTNKEILVRNNFIRSNLKSYIERHSNTWKIVLELEISDLIDKFFWCRNDSFETVGPNLFIGLTKIENICLSRKAIQFLEQNLFNSLVNLKRIFLGDNNLKEIVPGIFDGLYNLEDIDLSVNKIKVLKANVFKGLKNLKIIDLGDNQIEKIHQNVFNGLDNLQIIDLQYNNIQAIHPDLFRGLVNLKRIYFYENCLKEIDPNQFKGLVKLEWLIFDYNQIDKIDPQIFIGLINLRVISFNSNQIKTIHPNHFKNLKSLIKIDFKNNKIEEADKNLFYLNGIEKFKCLNF